MRKKPIKKSTSTKRKRTLKMIMESSYIPKRNESKPLGDDAHFICHKYQTFGVADGVGGWAEHGVDAGKYARRLMKNTVAAVRDQLKSEDISPKKVLNEGFSKTFVDGSSTACVITLRRDHMLHCINVGDSGFVVVRGGKIVYKSPVQQRGFNYPYQLAVEGADIPDDGEEIVFNVEDNDIIVAGTDGLFDNVFDNELEDIVGLGLDLDENGMGMEMEPLAVRIAEFALEKAVDGIRSSPFEQAAMAAGEQHLGGKYDDITVVVAYVFAPVP